MARALKIALAGAITIVVGRMAAMGKLPRNPVVGIRIPSTMCSDDAWLAGHRAAASALTAAGLGPIVAALVVGATMRGPDSQRAVLRVANAWLLGWIGLATLQAGRAARDAHIS
jgi:hypothetical protein